MTLALPRAVGTQDAKTEPAIGRDSAVVRPASGENNPGDTFLANEDAFSPDGRLIGYDQLRLTGMFRQEVFIEATVVIRGRGHIVVEGLVGFTEQRPALAVVGAGPASSAQLGPIHRPGYCGPDAPP